MHLVKAQLLRVLAVKSAEAAERGAHEQSFPQVAYR